MESRGIPDRKIDKAVSGELNKKRRIHGYN